MYLALALQELWKDSYNLIVGSVFQSQLFHLIQSIFFEEVYIIYFKFKSEMEVDGCLVVDYDGGCGCCCLEGALASRSAGLKVILRKM